MAQGLFMDTVSHLACLSLWPLEPACLQQSCLLCSDVAQENLSYGFREQVCCMRKAAQLSHIQNNELVPQQVMCFFASPFLESCNGTGTLLLLVLHVSGFISYSLNGLHEKHSSFQASALYYDASTFECNEFRNPFSANNIRFMFRFLYLICSASSLYDLRI